MAAQPGRGGGNLTTPQNSIRVLIADDHPIIRTGLKAAVEYAAGLTCVGEATDADTAVELNSSLNPDVLLLDLQMPNGGGIGATKRIIAQQPDARIVILTSFDSQEEIKEVMDAGAKGYILKSSASSEIIGAIRAVDRGGTVLDPQVATKLLRPSANSDDGFPQVTEREKEILRLMSQGRSNRQIGEKLNLAEATIKSLVTVIFRKLNVSDRTQAVFLASQRGIIPL